MTTTTYEHLFAFFGLQKNPFGASPDSRFFFSTPAHEAALAELLFAVHTRQGLMLLTGEAGAGKTTLLRQLLDALQQRGFSSSYVFHSRLDVDYLFRFILQDFGIACNSHRKGEILEALHEWLMARHAAGDTPVILIDEAQALPTDTIDELRLLLNLEEAEGKLVQIILCGQPELNEMLRKPELRQLRQRVMFRSKLPLLTRPETCAYIQARLSIAGLADPHLFPPETVDAIFRYSRGIPRTINLVCEHALINAYAEHKQEVSPDAIRYIAGDFDLVENPLSVRQDAGEGRRSVAHFPAPAADSGSLSAHRLAFLGESTPRQLASPMPEAPSSRGAVEQLLTLGDIPPSDKVAMLAARETSTIALEPAVLPSATAGVPEAVEDAVLAKQETPVVAVAEPTKPSATASILEKVYPPPLRPAKNSALSCYFTEVVGSLRRDVRELRRDWAAAFGGTRREKSRPTHKHSRLPV